MTTTQQFRLKLLAIIGSALMTVVHIAFGQMPPIPDSGSNYTSEILVVHFSDDKATWGAARWTKTGTNWNGVITLETNWPYGSVLRVKAPAIWSRVKVFQFTTNYTDTWPAMTPVTSGPNYAYTLCWTNSANFSIDLRSWSPNVFVKGATITRTILP